MTNRISMSTMGMMHGDFAPFGGVNEQVAASRPNDREPRVLYAQPLTRPPAGLLMK